MVQCRLLMKNFSAREAKCSSTWRELLAISFSLRAFAHFLRNSEVLWRTDNYAASLIVPSGSRVEKLQLLAEDIYEFCSQQKNIPHC